MSTESHQIVTTNTKEDIMMTPGSYSLVLAKDASIKEKTAGIKFKEHKGSKP